MAWNSTLATVRGKVSALIQRLIRLELGEQFVHHFRMAGRCWLTVSRLGRTAKGGKQQDGRDPTQHPDRVSPNNPPSVSFRIERFPVSGHRGPTKAVQAKSPLTAAKQANGFLTRASRNQARQQTWRERPRLPQTDSSVCSGQRRGIRLRQPSALPPGNASTNRDAANLEVHATS